MKPFHAITAIAIIFNLLSCTNNRHRTDREKLREMSLSPDSKISNENFHFDLPEGWIRVDTIVEGNNVTFLFNQNAAFHPMINITNASMHGKTHEAYISGTKEYLSNNMPGIRFRGNGNFNIGEKSCFWYTYENFQANTPREITYYSIDNNGVSINITAGVDPGGTKLHKQTFDKIVKSFSIEN